MLNINDLERRHRIYKLKSLIPYIVIFVSICVIVIVIMFVNSSQIFKSNEAKHNQEIFEIELEETKNIPNKIIDENNTIKEVISKQEILEEPNANEKFVLSPSLNFISNIKHGSISSNINYQRIADKIEKPKPVKNEKVLKPAKEEPKEITIEEIELQVAAPFKIHRQNTQEDMSHVIQRFNKNNNPALSLFIAKKYYELEDYSQSYNYALITNRINDNIEASWIIFAKSLVKLNRKKEAVDTLKKYIDHSKSSQAKTLLEEIERGKFK